MQTIRTIKSYVIREGRMTDAQQRALDLYLPLWGLSSDSQWDFSTIFNRVAPTIIEIGFGMGNSLVEMAAQHPEENFIGLEVHRPGVGALLAKAAAQEINNLRVALGDAVLTLKNAVPDATVARFQIFFPDPWPKTRHHKRRLLQKEFIHLLEKKLQPGGILHIATDWAPYAEYILEIMATQTQFVNLASSGLISERPAYRPLTKYEMRGQKLGHSVADLIFKKIAAV